MVADDRIQWIRAGIIGGICASILYPALLILPGPSIIVTLAASMLGLSIGVGSLGLMRLLTIEQGSVPAVLGSISNFAAGALFTAMALIQLAVKQVGLEAGIPLGVELEAVWLGLDVAWDVYIAAGTMFFGWAMLSHGRFRWYFAIPGLMLGFFLLIFNLASFPDPPASSGLIDLGPFVGLWYLAATIQTWRSLDWANARIV